MAEFKLNIGNPKDKKTYKKEVKEAAAEAFIGKKIGDSVKGDSFEFPGYEFTITGGSDFCGFPMRRDVTGSARKKVLIAGGVGMRSKRKGLRLRKTVAGNTIYEKTAQINLKVTKAGKAPLGEPEAAKEEAPKEN